MVLFFCWKKCENKKLHHYLINEVSITKEVDVLGCCLANDALNNWPLI